MIAVERLSFGYPDAAPALREISFTLPRGQKTVLLGANGSGKSTLLKILAGLLFARTGSYRFDGETITRGHLRSPARRRAFRRRVGLLFQNPDVMLFNPTVAEEIAFGPRQLGLDRIEERTAQWAARFGIGHLLARPPFELSGGEKQKVCLAALLILEPDLLLLDEPTANLDPRSTGWLVDLLQELDVTLLVATHNLSLAGELGAATLLLSESHELIYAGGMRELLADPERLLAANLVHRHRHRHGEVEHRHFHSHDWR